MLTTYETPSDGPETAPPLVIAHGLFGSARNWAGMAKRLAAGRRVVAVDMRNHGSSPWAATHDYTALAADLAEVIAALGGQADVLGHSMGGKAAMVLALTRPELVRRLVVGDIAPVAYAHSRSNLIAAMRGVDLTRVTRRAEADRQLADSVDDPGVRAFLLQSLDIEARQWQLNLDALEAEMPQITSWPGIAGTFDGPVLMLTGAASPYVLPEHEAGLRELFPVARIVAVPGAGHWLHAERPAEVAAEVLAFLNA